MDTQLAATDGTVPLSSDQFAERFHARERAQRYRDRFAHGRHARVDALERKALRDLLSPLPRIATAMDIPCGVGRLSDVLAEVADRVILADASPIMLDFARECLAPLNAEIMNVRCEAISLPDSSVELIFCHRFLHHLEQCAERMNVLREFARVSSKYVVLNYYPSGWRTRARRLARSLFRMPVRDDRRATVHQSISEAEDVGLRFFRMVPIRRFPMGGYFLLFQSRV